MKKEYNISIDEDTYNAASQLFERLGMDIDTAISVFLTKSLYVSGIPFLVEMPLEDDFDMFYDDYDEEEDFPIRNNRRKKA